jgi:type I restriction enzyme S subunit
MIDLPEGWTWAKLEDLVLNPKQDIVDGPFGSNLKASEYVESGVPIIRLQNVQRNRFIEKNLRYLTPEKAAGLLRHSFQKGDIVITKLGEPLGEACLVPDSLEKGIIVADIVRVRLNEKFISKLFTIFAINSPSVTNQLSLEVKGTTRPRVNLSHIRSLKIPVAPLREQDRMAAKLEKLLSRVNAEQERLASIPRLLKRFRQSVLAAACVGQLTIDWRGVRSDCEFSCDHDKLTGSKSELPPLPKSWEWTVVEKVCEKIVDCPHSTPVWTDTGFICVRTTNFKPNHLDLSEVRFVSKETYKSRVERLTPIADDVLYSREGGILGVACIVPAEVELCLGQRMMLLRAESGYIPRLLMYWLNSPEILKRVQELTGGSASPHLNVRDIKSFPIPRPPISEQQEIVRRVEALFKTADALESRYRKAKEHVDKLPQSILARAFRGELVTTEAELAGREGRDYEPASVLLERIQQERAQQQESAKSKPKRTSKSKKDDATRKMFA